MNEHPWRAPNRRPPVVLVPGFSGRTGEDFPFLLPMLERRHRVVSVDFTTPGVHTLGDLVSRIGVAVARCDEPPAVVGYSLGGVAAAAFAAQQPAALSSLAVVAGWMTPAPKLGAFAGLWAELQAERSAALAAAARQALYSADGWDSARPPLVDDIAARLVALGSTLDVSAMAPGIAVPTLVVGCASDEVATTWQSKLLFGAIADARYAQIDAGHAVVHERPAELLAVLGAFLTEPTRYPAGTLIGEDRP
ncbi:alpha/beta fold hydrolase [Cryobacterium sp. TMS1-13-1]|uniref:alpha/beta fold hydrolase n=1 Tax=Cryobacterium sp. TMS1-13-1 TaxID=1259220 RepID=UPI00106DA756|nr:alpha/beta hydrolase [Cryobacterium sp. TMS1-13-1]TFD19542.1 alpha/beta hydrolase [Cryobacterium sp. TMS1-13-1]